MSLPKYSEYKKTNVDWLTEVPAHWNIQSCRGVLTDRNERNDPLINENYLSLMANIGIILYEEKGDVGNKKPEDLGKCKQVYPGDLVINSMNYGIGSYGLSKHRGVCSPVYIVLKPKLKEVEERYIFRILEIKKFQQYAQSFGNGILEHRASISWDILKNIGLPIPPIKEQEVIVQFLDHEVDKIDKLILEQEKLIELLREKRQIVISEAVTKGLNPKVKVKDSGVAWLGKVPESWDIVRLKKITSRISSGKTPSGGAEVYVDIGVIFLRSQNVYDEGLRLEDVVRIPEKIDAEMSSSRVKGGDILLNITGGSIGRSCCLPYDFESANVNQHVCAIRLSDPDMVSFVELFFKSDIIKKQIDYIQNGAAREGLNFEQIGNFSICIPPPDERKLLVEEVKRKIKNFNDLISQIIESTSLLQERRSALISAAVSGQIDVRTTNGN